MIRRKSMEALVHKGTSYPDLFLETQDIAVRIKTFILEKNVFNQNHRTQH